MDARNNEIGGVLSQIQDGQEWVVAYFSKTLSRAGRNCCMTWQELLVIVKMLEHFHEYFFGQEFHLCTDHSALTWLLSSRTWKNRQPAQSSVSRCTALHSNIARDGSIPMPMHSQGDHVTWNVLAARRSNDRQAAWRYGSSLLPLWMVGTVLPWGGSSLLTVTCVRYYMKWRLDNILNGRISLTSPIKKKTVGPVCTPLLCKVACWSIIGSWPVEGPRQPK
jgi:hypothetical protein